MENIVIRDANILDKEMLQKLEASCFDAKIRENFDFVLNNSNYLYLVALNNEKNIVAYAGASISYEQGDLLSVCVDIRYRKQGLATKLLIKLFNKIVAKGVEKIFLEVNKKNLPAQKLYEKLGFTLINERKNYYGEDDALIMVKEL